MLDAIGSVDQRHAALPVAFRHRVAQDRDTANG
jgi:hypothetical protein